MIDLQTESFAPLDECSMQIKRALSVLATVTQSRSMKLPSYVDKITRLEAEPWMLAAAISAEVAGNLS